MNVLNFASIKRQTHGKENTELIIWKSKYSPKNADFNGIQTPELTNISFLLLTITCQIIPQIGQYKFENNLIKKVCFSKVKTFNQANSSDCQIGCTL